MFNNKISPRDLYTFIKDNLIMYIISFFLSLVLTFGLFFYSSYTQKNVEKNVQEEQPLFSFILENSQGNIMNASGAVKQVFLTSLQDTKQFSEETLEKLNVSYNDIQNTMDVKFISDEQIPGQKQISDYLQKEINEGKLSFFNNKQVYYINKNIGNDQLIIPSSETISTKKIIFIILIDGILTVVLGTILASWKQHNTKTITQSFMLGNDVQLIDIEALNLTTDQNKLNSINSLLNGNSKTKLLVLEENTSIKREELAENEHVMIYSNLQNISKPVLFIPDEILIICFKKNTSKYWYRQQVEIAKALTNEIKTIYI